MSKEEPKDESMLRIVFSDPDQSDMSPEEKQRQIEAKKLRRESAKKRNKETE